jgi:hypothetical protein
MYAQPGGSGLQQNEDFLGSGTKTVASKNWDKIDENTGGDIIKRNDIEDYEPPF